MSELFTSATKAKVGHTIPNPQAQAMSHCAFTQILEHHWTVKRLNFPGFSQQPLPFIYSTQSTVALKTVLCQIRDTSSVNQNSLRGSTGTAPWQMLLETFTQTWTKLVRPLPIILPLLWKGWCFKINILWFRKKIKIKKKLNCMAMHTTNIYY